MTTLAKTAKTSAARRAKAPSMPAVKPRATAPTSKSADIFDLIGKSANIEEAAMAMQAMSHPLRIKILCLLSSGEVAVSEIVEAVGTTQGNVSQHLAILKASNMIVSRAEGKKIFYRIEDKRVVKIVAMTRDVFCSV
jgi:DNA-binding transcriptional ArsR family regulator